MQNILSRTTPVLLLVTLFFIPISTSLRSIFFPLSMLAIILNSQARRHLFTACKQWPCMIAIALAVWVALACLFSPAPWETQQALLSKTLKILFLPLLVAGFYQRSTRQWALYSFLAAMFVVFTVALYHYIQWLSDPAIDTGKVFHDRIMTGLMIAVAAWISASRVISHTKTERWIMAFLAIAFSLQILFINTSRTGYVIYMVLGALCIITLSGWRQALTGAVCLLLLLIAAINFSPVLSNTLHYTQQEISSIQKHKQTTSIGFRMQFHAYARELFLEKPLFGHGTGAFTWQFEKDNPIPAWGPKLFEPHSQYWLIAVENGFIGFALLIAFLGSLLFITLRLQYLRSGIAYFLIAFYLANLSDSLLLYSATGYLFLIFAGIGIAEYIDEYQPRSVPVRETAKAGVI